MKPSLKKVNDGVSKRLQGMLDRANSIRSFLDRNIYRMYQNKQRERWMSENQTEGQQWHAVGEQYARYKKKRFSSYEGAGEKLLIATGNLFHAVIGPGMGQRKIVTNTKLYIAVGVNYAGYVNDIRNFTEWSQRSKEDYAVAIKDFVFHSKRYSA